MVSLSVIALLAIAAPGAPSASGSPLSLDLGCYRLMAELAADDDPVVRTAGLTGAQYFLGRLDARAPWLDPEAATRAIGRGGRDRLIPQCGALMGAGGRDFRALGRRLVLRRTPI